MPANRYPDFFESLLKHSWKIEPVQNQSLALKTSVKVGGSAYFLVSVSNIAEIQELFQLIRHYQIPWFILGKGTNLLIPEDGFPGVVIMLKGSFEEIIHQPNVAITCGAGASTRSLARLAKKHCLKGAEFLATIPGTVGGAICLNAGAFDQQMQDIVKCVKILDQEGEIKTVNQDKIEFSYRHSTFTNSSKVILKAVIQLITGNQPKIAKKEREMIHYRRETQPIDKHTWGSVFLNPPGYSAGKLIESCDLKGKGFGKAIISPMHANFIENTGGATFTDLIKTIDLARTAVLGKFGIKLETEGHIIPNISE